MMSVDSTHKIPIKMWCEPDARTMEQAGNLAELPFARGWIAIMPDAHVGYGMPIGGVMATKHVIVPNAVGVDIGCGVQATKTTLTYIDAECVDKWVSEAYRSIPTGFNWHKDAKFGDDLPNRSIHAQENDIVHHQWKRARQQMGTLGGGNHFIELQRGDDGHIWIMAHSGSRNLGKQVADRYNKVAKAMNAKWYSSIDPKADLAFLPMDSIMGRAYRREMEYCVGFAFNNRTCIMNTVLEALHAITGGTQCNERIDVAHNYATLEHHFGQNVCVHRKGATRAHDGEYVIIPGSQGTPSYIGHGRGNHESFMSCSHGAGRCMGRKQAKRELVLEDELLRMSGIVHRMKKASLDEAPSAYKDIEEVMENQADLVAVDVKLTPLGVVKG